MKVALPLRFALLAFALSSLPAAAQTPPSTSGGAGPYPLPHYSCTDAAPRAKPETFSVAYRPFPEPYSMFGAQASEAAEAHLAALGLKSAPRDQADVVVAIRFAHARIAPRSARAHHDLAFTLVGTCPSSVERRFKTIDDLKAILDAFVRGELRGADTARVSDERH
jgi:hypothetical protein